MKWLPVPSVPRCTRLFVFLSCGCLSVSRSNRCASVAHASTIAGGGSPQEPVSRLLRFIDRPCGTACSIAERMPSRWSGRSLATSEVRAAIMPQPMSTPTAAGITAPLVGITEPTVAPMPTWTSGIAATCLNTNGICAARASWARAPSSTGTPRVHILIGTPPSTCWKSYSVSVTWDLLLVGHISAASARRRRIDETFRPCGREDSNLHSRYSPVGIRRPWGAGDQLVVRRALCSIHLSYEPMRRGRNRTGIPGSGCSLTGIRQRAIGHGDKSGKDGPEGPGALPD